MGVSGFKIKFFVFFYFKFKIFFFIKKNLPLLETLKNQTLNPIGLSIFSKNFSLFLKILVLNEAFFIFFKKKK